LEECYADGLLVCTEWRCHCGGAIVADIPAPLNPLKLKAHKNNIEKHTSCYEETLLHLLWKSNTDSGKY
jgi:hypothetical protein